MYVGNMNTHLYKKGLLVIDYTLNMQISYADLKPPF